MGAAALEAGCGSDADCRRVSGEAKVTELGENKLNKRMRFTESIMTQILRTEREGQFNHYSGADEVSSVAFVDDDQWRINHRQW